MSVIMPTEAAAMDAHPPAEPPKRKSEAKATLGPTLYELLKLNPTNPQVRAQVMAKCLKAPPEALQSFPELVDWIEFNIEPKTLPAPLDAQGRPITVSQEEIVIPITGSEVETGRCRYSQRNSLRGRFILTREDMLALAGDACDLTELVEEVTDHIDENRYDYLETYDSSDFDTENPEADGTEDSQWEVSGDLRQMVIGFLSRINPERLRELENEE